MFHVGMWGTVTAFHWITSHTCVFKWMLHWIIGHRFMIQQATHRNQSTAMMRVMSSVGSPTEVSTITMVTRPAWGMPAAPILAAVAVILDWRETHRRIKQCLLLFRLMSIFICRTSSEKSYLIVMIWPKFISILLTWAMKMAASASYRAVPSMLIVAPTGSTKRVIRLSILLFSSRHLNVTGRVAELPGER